MNDIRTQIMSAFQFRHACKEFDAGRKIPEDDFRLILETGRLSPSSFGFEPWYFLVVQDAALREKLREFTWGGKKQIPTASHLLVCLVRTGHFMRYDSDYISGFLRDIQQLPEDMAQRKQQVYENFQRHEFDLLSSERAMNDWAARQTYIAMGNMMTAAAMIGVDSCPLEGFDRPQIQRVLEQDFDVDGGQFVIGWMCAFGYRVNPPKVKTRQPMEAVVRWMP